MIRASFNIGTSPRPIRQTLPLRGVLTVAILLSEKIQFVRARLIN